MRVALDSDQFPAATRLDTWRGLMCDTFVGIDCAFADEDFRSVIDGHVVEEHGITRVTSTRRRVDRSPSWIKRDTSEVAFFGMMLAGSARIAQGGREAVLERGTVVLHDSTRPFRTYLSEGSDVIWLAVPKASLAGRTKTIEDLAAIRYMPSRPVERFARHVLAGLDEAQGLILAPQAVDRLVVQMIDLLVLTIIAHTPALAPNAGFKGNIRRH